MMFTAKKVYTMLGNDALWQTATQCHQLLAAAKIPHAIMGGVVCLHGYWYLLRFAGESPFAFSALDVKTYAMALLKSKYREATKRHMPKRWFDPLAHTHIALDDAIEQGALFCNMLAENTHGRVND